MPYKIEKRNDKYCVVNSDNGDNHGCHATKKDAVDQMRALYVNVPDARASVEPEQLVEEPEVVEELAQGEEIPPLTVAGETPEPSLDGIGVEWESPTGICFENQMTGDSRIFEAGSVQWPALENFPLPFRWVRADQGGHQSAVTIGRVDSIFRDMQNPTLIKAKGIILNGENSPPESAEYLNLLENQAAGGVSIDADNAQFDVIEVFDANGVMTGAEQHFSQLQIRGLTAVDIPAFMGAKIALVKSETPTYMLAAAIPVKPPVEWFENPNLEGPTPLQISADGQVSGHLALFDTCHIGMKQCVTPPKGNTYAYFHMGELESENGELVEVGHLTFNTGHADMNSSPRAAASHYDDTGKVGADVRAGEDEYGVWVAGALRSNLSDSEIREFRAAPLSGDWRRIGGRLELVAALSVNTPGFPVPRAKVLVADGREQAIIGYVPEAEFDEQRKAARLSMKQRIARTFERTNLENRILGG